MLLTLTGIKRSFPGVQALSGVDFELVAGEVHALMGENGAGKSTLMKIVGGVLSPDEGTMTLRGRPYRPRSPRQARSLGIGFVHQELNLVESLSVEENLLLGELPHRLGLVDQAALRRQAREALECLGEELPLSVPAGSLNVGQKQMLEIARALYARAEVLIMDEPTAALSDKEAGQLFAAIARLKARGTGIIYISHRMEEVYRLSDRITVLRDGASLGTSPLAEITPEEVVRRMVGRELGELAPPQRAAPGEVVLKVEGLTRQPAVRNVSFEVRAGEVVGLAGLVGAGRTEIARLIAGADACQSGRIELARTPVRMTSPRQAISLGVGLVPEERKSQGLVLGLGVAENLALASLTTLARGPFLVASRLTELAARFISELRIRTPSPAQPVGTLSGGNQQKVVMGKWLARDTRLLILDEPTRGVDVGAKAELYRVIEEQLQRQAAVLLISSELPELLRLSDRVLVISQGRLVAEYNRSEASAEKIMHSALEGLS
ncbi:sugar ABC transporter ATP-binding protein [bacterium CPR1]|nr:sugar ABC transporter ATP-binding protein [bacterium CPR1]